MTQPVNAEAKRSALSSLTERSREILRRVVDAYVTTGAPVGSRTLSRSQGMELSPATVRNVMADLEDAGLLYAPHTSAGRLPTEMGLRLFVDGLLEYGNISENDRKEIEAHCSASGRSLSQVLEDASEMLSELTGSAGLVVAPKLQGERLKHIEFVNLGPGRALVVLVTQSGAVENRVIDVPRGLPAASLVEASNYLSERLVGRTLGEVQQLVHQELDQQRAELNELTTKLVEAGIADWSGSDHNALIVRGHSQLLEDVSAIEDLERIRSLFSALETKESFLKLLDLTENAEGVQIFIGAENELFGMSGCSMVVAPYGNAQQQQFVGAIGVIGPTRIDYARIIPMVDYTAKVIGSLVG
ncbi:heat-inducible transcription repressor HrcA [Limimonas halophila]|uniref:Heat-inducible transcription repressor HrcA n=1 Tax=Limimonas halophila TaxID=1082479 RepID=A0A1G7T434_9PROT|nr:heat-inducible transcriptional repressor HrcA [Limimonas halophila]SDG30025.1 heat-inducible transcription repressor HrcA [Limimonas halophila]